MSTYQDIFAYLRFLYVFELLKQQLEHFQFWLNLEGRLLERSSWSIPMVHNITIVISFIDLWIHLYISYASILFLYLLICFNFLTILPQQILGSHQLFARESLEVLLKFAHFFLACICILLWLLKNFDFTLFWWKS